MKFWQKVIPKRIWMTSPKKTVTPKNEARNFTHDFYRLDYLRDSPVLEFFSFSRSRSSRFSKTLLVLLVSLWPVVPDPDRSWSSRRCRQVTYRQVRKRPVTTETMPLGEWTGALASQPFWQDKTAMGPHPEGVYTYIVFRLFGWKIIVTFSDWLMW